MPTIQELKDRVNAAIDRQADQLIKTAKTILNNPEPGFREFKTAKLVGEVFDSFGIAHQDGIGITGLKGYLDGATQGPTVGVMGELDSLKVQGHPHVDSETDAAHACGHHCQIGMMLGVAAGLQADGVLENLSGRIALMAVPAEEYIEVAYRDDLRREGKLEFIGGKPEFIRLGALDDVDVAMMTHTSSNSQEGKIAFGGTNNGMVAKRIRFLGRASHAGGAPWLGVNALNAAMIAMSGIHAQRETYQDAHTVRIHPIITQGGVAVSSVPADVRMETYVRGANTEGFLDASTKVDRALRAGAMAVGGSVEITTLPGYLPIQSDESMLDLYKVNAASLVGEENLVRLQHRTGSTDMGDVSQLMPVIHPYVVAATGNGHGIDYVVQDYELGVITGAKAMAMTVIDLLSDGARQANRIKAEYNAPLTKDSYLSLMRGMLKEGTYTK
ncbi:MAG TPA: amidohydrolase [Dehalococcoidia bacterium]|jgi:amidohydrolase|nr:amidohydrolase [SAR202 cluster bacterium]HBJ32638.1 amidohydrolase [Dehalococcoidia bacterium]HIM91579.1 amidohydrolase [Dehalococcoidia bacterium]|tara:strand:+ start:2533 stop:3861 length:1329 start_codon:yes stop_codon:yes gene_type:complete